MKKTEPEYFDRKRFLKTAGSTALFAFMGIGFYGCGSPTSTDDDNIINETPPGDDGDNNSGVTITNNGNTVEIDLTKGDVAALTSSGGWLLINAASVLIVNIDDSVFRAFTSVCTHQGCSDDWSFSDNLFICNCHDSRFNTNGEVVRGPANSDLDEFDVDVEGDIITVRK
ncbi:MAG: Rieske 2Fe-2S domain-containing protein [Bacteroidetes bacterium]|jgi:Rieske Fe-S protein|nr:Rieske 2Fe-2S domain-containing protein [Bacteroidota bacterium]